MRNCLEGEGVYADPCPGPATILPYPPPSTRAMALAYLLSLSSTSLSIGTMLCDVPSPALLLDCTTARRRGVALDSEHLGQLDGERFQDLVYVHASVLTGREASDGPVGTTTRAGGTCETSDIVLACLDASASECGGSDAFVGLGLNNHFTGGYYWGRSSGPGAALPAPGVRLRTEGDDGLLTMVRSASVLRNDGEEANNSNDGKRSEWAEFLRSGDQVQIVVSPGELAADGAAAFETLVGVTRDGDGGVPPGAEPLVEAVWTRDRKTGGFARKRA